MSIFINIQLFSGSYKFFSLLSVFFPLSEIVRFQGPAPAGSRGTLRMNGVSVGKRDDMGLIMDW